MSSAASSRARRGLAAQNRPNRFGGEAAAATHALDSRVFRKVDDENARDESAPGIVFQKERTVKDRVGRIRRERGEGSAHVSADEGVEDGFELETGSGVREDEFAHAGAVHGAVFVEEVLAEAPGHGE